MAHTPKKNAAVPAGDDSASGQGAINGHVPTASEIKFIFTLINNLKSKPDFDWETIAANGGLTKKSAQERWRVLRIKYDITLPEGPAGTPGRKPKNSIIPSVSPSASMVRQRAGQDDDDNNDEEAAAGSSTVTPKKTGRTRKTPVKDKRAAAAATAAPAATPAKKRGAAEAAAAGSGHEGQQPAKKKGKGKRKEPAKPAAAEPEAQEDGVPMYTSSALSSVPSNISDLEI
ncbi:hypothetical protein MMYC01_201377 [Madurella mycetomatis]|uniref:Uncharacterized protein n=1 Tax=Madurella mycetomatis TaxID=100816 RepID=A0A175WCJ6_9PEZI|nr:hypothetical protein MMYC01_201377 [Madurella mycetomatis]